MTVDQVLMQLFRNGIVLFQGGVRELILMDKDQLLLQSMIMQSSFQTHVNNTIKTYSLFSRPMLIIITYIFKVWLLYFLAKRILSTSLEKA